MLLCLRPSLFVFRTPMSVFFPSSLRRSICQAGARRIKLQTALYRSSIYCYSTDRKKKKSVQNVDDQPVVAAEPSAEPPAVKEESDAVYVVRKGNLLGVYKSLEDCPNQASSVCDPPVSVFKGSSLSKETLKHLSSFGLRNALYVMDVAHVTEDLFGKLEPCPFQIIDGTAVSTPPETSLVNKAFLVSKQFDTVNAVCILKFDGASKGNPGKAGAGAILSLEDGSIVWKLYEGLGRATNNVAEYRAMIFGLKNALDKGFKKIRVQGDSKLVCNQMQGLWQVKDENIAKLYKEAKGLKNQFSSFKISHIARELNADADALANVAVSLDEGETLER